MELKLLENRHTEIKVPLKQLPVYSNLITAYIALHGGRKTKENKRFAYFEVNTDLLNSPKPNRGQTLT